MQVLKKGASLRCPNGHHYAEAIRDVRGDGPINSFDYKLPNGDRPNEAQPQCAKCGAAIDLSSIKDHDFGEA